MPCLIALALHPEPGRMRTLVDHFHPCRAFASAVVALVAALTQLYLSSSQEGRSCCLRLAEVPCSALAECLMALQNLEVRLVAEKVQHWMCLVPVPRSEHLCRRCSHSVAAQETPQESLEPHHFLELRPHRSARKASQQWLLHCARERRKSCENRSAITCA